MNEMDYSGKHLHCERCKHEWTGRKRERPVRCPRCSDVNWDKKREEAA